MKHLATDSVERPALASLGPGPFRAAMELAGHKLGTSDHARPGDGHPDNDVPGEFEPSMPPVEPDEGPLPTHIPDDPEHDRIIDPGENPPLQARRTRYQIEVTRCP